MQVIERRREARSFNSRTLGRVRPRRDVDFWTEMEFQFTHPGKGATEFECLEDEALKFQFTHPGKGATG